MNHIILEACTQVCPEDQGVRRTGDWLDPVFEWAAEGLSICEVTWTDHQGRTRISYDVEHAAEYAPPRAYSFDDLARGIVAQIGGQNYRILVAGCWREGTQAPQDAVVHFIPTDEPETPWTPWDEAAAREAIVREGRDAAKSLRSEGFDDLAEQREREIARVESGEAVPRPGGDVILFGKPCFLQNPIFPAPGGVAARCLMVMETGWGDAGNINLLFSVDAEGRPEKVWMEASCC